MEFSAKKGKEKMEFSASSKPWSINSLEEGNGGFLDGGTLHHFKCLGDEDRK
jgi:hypothetical protein